MKVFLGVANNSLPAGKIRNILEVPAAKARKGPSGLQGGLGVLPG